MEISLESLLLAIQQVHDELEGDVPPVAVPHILEALHALNDKACALAGRSMDSAETALPVMHDLLGYQDLFGGRKKSRGSVEIRVYFACLHTVAEDTRKKLDYATSLSLKLGEWPAYLRLRSKVIVLHWHVFRLAVMGVRYWLGLLPCSREFERRAAAILRLI